MGRYPVAAIALVCLMLAEIAPAQMAVSVKSGMINYVEGKVLLDGRPTSVKLDSFPQIQNGSEFRTQEGRAEVLLGPGVVMRLGENSAVRMVSNDIMNTRVEFLTGSAIIETAEMVKDQTLTLTANGAMMGLLNKGLYRLDSEPPRISVYDGEAWVTVGGQPQLVKHGRRLLLNGLAVAEKFDAKDGDALFRWARRRSEYLAVANVSAARSAARSGSWGRSMWSFNPYFGTYTFLPMFGFYSNYWGCGFYGPDTVYLGGYYNPYGWWYLPGPGNSGPVKVPRPTHGARPTGPPALPGHLGALPEPGHPVRHHNPGGQGDWAGVPGGRSGGFGPYSGADHAARPGTTGGSGHPHGSGPGWTGNPGASGGGRSNAGGHSAGPGGYSGGSHSSGGYSGGSHSGGGGGYSGGGGGGHSAGGTTSSSGGGSSSNSGHGK